MAEFKEQIPHTGGVLTIRKSGGQYSLGYRHMSHKFGGLTQLSAEAGVVRGVVPVRGLYLNPEPPPPVLLIMLPSDGDGMYGHQCPGCHGYFRANHVTTEFCPYCDVRSDWKAFLTVSQREFVKKEYDAILKATKGEDGETVVDFDAQIADHLSSGDSWVYPEEKQQSRFECSRCKTDFDVLGDYVRCPSCAHPTLAAVIIKKLNDLEHDFEKDAASIPTTQREERQRRWRHYVPLLVAEFDGLGRNAILTLSHVPLTEERRRLLLALSFQSPVVAAERTKEWFDINVFKDLSDDDVDWVKRMFNRRHLFEHNAGKVDDEYLRRTGDETVRLHEVIQIRSREVKRLVEMVRQMALNLVSGVENLAEQRKAFGGPAH